MGWDAANSFFRSSAELRRAPPEPTIEKLGRREKMIMMVRINNNQL